jgi:anti-anti-sigma factor
MNCASHTRDDGSALLVIAGEIDVACAGEVREAGLKLLAGTDCSRLTVDLMDVTFMDSTALSALIEIRNAADQRGTAVALLDVAPNVLRVLTITGLDQIFEIEHTNR